MNNLNEKIGFIGAGNMATALISGLINSNFSPTKIIASSPEKEHLQKLSEAFKINTCNDNQEIINKADIIILAVKPNIIEEVINEIKISIKQKNILLISIAAGIKIEKIETLLGADQRIIRAMPNTPASIMEGVTALCSNNSALSEDVAKARILFECAGKVTEINETNIDIFTALIGSGPAYIFYLIEAMLESSKNLKLPEEEKVNLISAMIAGSANLAKNSPDSPEMLRKKVTSPGGVTQKAIEEFEKYGMKEIIKKCMDEAEKKSIELGEK